jgi:hypothetical protein
MQILKTVVCAITAIGLFTSMGVIPANAATITTFDDDRAGWLAASSGVTTIDFNNLAAAPNFSFQPSLTTAGVVFESFFSSFATNGVLVKNIEDWGTGNYILGPSQDQFNNYSFKITLPTGVTSFGVDLMYSSSYVSTFQVAVSTGDIRTTAATMANHTGPAFFGITSDTAINYLIFTPTYITSIEPRLIIDNVSFGTAGAVGGGGGGGDTTEETPEAATLLLCAGGLLLFHRMRRRSQANPARTEAVRSTFVLAGAN